jgi:hypothetical protein
MLELGHDARVTCEEVDVAIIASANEGGRPEDESHGVPVRMAKTIVPDVDVSTGRSIAIMGDSGGGRVTANGL